MEATIHEFKAGFAGSRSKDTISWCMILRWSVTKP